MSILDKLNDLHKQATVERSHYYVAGTAKEAAVAIAQMQDALIAIKATLVGEHTTKAATVRALVDTALENT